MYRRRREICAGFVLRQLYNTLETVESDVLSQVGGVDDKREAYGAWMKTLVANDCCRLVCYFFLLGIAVEGSSSPACTISSAVAIALRLHVTCLRDAGPAKDEIRVEKPPCCG